MEDLFKKRAGLQQKRFAKYLKLIFNDHFVLVIFFLFGGFLFFYSTSLETIQPTQTYLLGIVALFWWVMLQVGNLATLAQPADSYFLLPKEGQMPLYLKKAFKHSLPLPILVLVASTFLAGPLILVLKSYPTWQLGLFLIELLALKAGRLFLSVQDLLLKKSSLTKWVLQLIEIGVIVLSLFLSPWLGAGLGLLLAICLAQPLYAKTRAREFSWDLFVATEQRRLKRLYQLVAVFTDVPEITNTVKRRRIFDPLLKKIPLVQKNTFTYLYARRFLRGGEYASLFLSVTSFGVVLILVLQQLYWVIGAAVLFFYLLGFQLLPLAKQFDYMTLTKLYPISTAQRQHNFLTILKIILTVASVCFVLASLFVLSPLHSLFLLLILTLENFLFCYFYAPKRLQTMDRY